MFKSAAKFVEDMQKQQSYRDMQNAAAAKTMRVAQSLAPKDTGHYARSFYVDEQEGTLNNSDIAAHLIEFGSINNPTYAPLRRAVRAAGYRLVETKK